MVSVSRYDSATVGSIWHPFAAAAVATSSCSDFSGSISRSLANQLSGCVLLDDMEGTAPVQREASNPLISRAGPSKLPKAHARLMVEINSQPSQEFPHSQDMATPNEQFPIESVSNMDSINHSPPPSPMRHPTKRHRLVHAADADSDCTSQEGLSQSLSQSDNSFREEGTNGLDRGPRTSRPPIPKSKRKSEPPRSTRKHPPSSSAGSKLQKHPASLITHFAVPTLPRASALQASSHWQDPHPRLYREYSVEREVGHGTYGVVFRAVHKQCGKAYAIKKSKKPAHSAAEIATWMEEVRVLALVEGHPHVIKYYDSWAEPGTAGGEHQHIKLELCGESLRVNVKSKRALNTHELWDVMRQMASALQHVHGLGLAHLDVKPDNIYRSLAEPDQLKLGDFGLATNKDGSKGVSEGDARYLAPELLKGGLQLDKADMFALGATVYELATASTLPAEGERWVALREGRLMMLPAVSQQLQSLIKKLLSSDPSVRPDAAAVVAICNKAMAPKERLPASRFGSQPSSQVSI